MRPLDEIAAPGTEERAALELLDLAALPRHLAIIMDGNGRWARARNLPRVEGHRAAIRAVRETIETIARLGIPVVTLYAFSTENWKRPRREVAALMSLLKEYIDRELASFQANNCRCGRSAASTSSIPRCSASSRRPSTAPRPAPARSSRSRSTTRGGRS